LKELLENENYKIYKIYRLTELESKPCKDKNLKEKKNMSLYFQSICSSSSGNCLLLWSEKTRIIIDCGLSSMKRTREVLNYQFNNRTTRIDAALITHNHSDHISHYPLRVLEKYGIPVYIHEDNIEQLKGIHFNGYKFKDLKLKPFINTKFTLGELTIKAFEVVHNPNFPTYGFEIFYNDKKVVIVTDLCEWENIYGHFIDADFIFVESNHDLGLLELYYNPNSMFHMPNPKTGNLLVNVVKESKKIPQVVMLGHISSQRNEAKIAINETKKSFKDAGLKMSFELLAAPLKDAGEVIELR
jgi:phosphoribosyl 1,2-cyclic phosphodiesterase